jgi:hypothetical protein
MAALSSAAGQIGWDSATQPHRPTFGPVRCHPDRGMHELVDVTLAVAGARDQWIPDEKHAVWGRLWSRPEPKQKLRLQPPPFFVPEPPIELPDDAPP